MRHVDALFAAMHEASDPRRRKCLATYFEGERRDGSTRSRFPGLTAVAARRVAVRFADKLRTSEMRALLASRIPEHRFVALEMLVHEYERGNYTEKERIAKLYMENLRHVDHWVLVDTSAPYILGDHLRKRSRRLLFDLASSRSVMRRRIAIVTTAAFIREDDFDDTLRIAARLLNDEHPLIHRAVGWMLREVGKRCEGVVERFLERHARAMPRLMLRYAVERLPEARRKAYLGQPRR